MDEKHVKHSFIKQKSTLYLIPRQKCLLKHQLDFCGKHSHFRYVVKYILWTEENPILCSTNIFYRYYITPNIDLFHNSKGVVLTKDRLTNLLCRWSRLAALWTCQGSAYHVCSSTNMLWVHFAGRIVDQTMLLLRVYMQRITIKNIQMFAQC